jgi:hypothetical protein
MPRPPILPQIDWKAVYDSGQDFENWLKRGENPEYQARMDEDRKSLAIEDAAREFLASVDRPVYIVAIAEDWCGDVVRHVPVLEAMAAACPHLHVRYIHRADRPDIFVRYLTNGGEAIPRFIFLSENWTECANWGALPNACKDIIARGKACGDVGAARKITNALYDADPHRLFVVRELMACIDIAVSTTPDPSASRLNPHAANV